MKMIYRSLSNRKLFLCLTAIAIAFLVGGLVSEQLPAQQEPPSGGSNVEITAGEAVVPSEFVGDVKGPSAGHHSGREKAIPPSARA